MMDAHQMKVKLYNVQARERRFCVRIASSKEGYYARILEEVAGEPGERTLAVDLRFPPRLELDPAAFYQDRKTYRAELVRLVNAELTEWRVDRHTAGDGPANTDAYIKANLLAWPDGHPSFVGDDLSDWHSVWPGSVPILQLA